MIFPGVHIYVFFFTLENLTHFFTEERIKKLAEVVKESATEITAIQVAEALGLSAVEAEMLVAGLKLGKELVCREKEVVTLKSKKDIDDLFKKSCCFTKVLVFMSLASMKMDNISQTKKF